MWRALVLSGALLLASCGPMPGSPVGTWKATVGTDRYEFLEDGTVLIDGMSGQWRKTGSDRYILTLQMYGTPITFVAEKDGRMLRVLHPTGKYQCIEREQDAGNGGVSTPRPGRCT